MNMIDYSTLHLDTNSSKGTASSKKGYGCKWFFVSFTYFFFGQHELKYFFLSRGGLNFFPEFNIRLYDKNSESDFFFFLHQNQNIFFSNIGNQNIFLEKKP